MARSGGAGVLRGASHDYQIITGPVSRDLLDGWQDSSLPERQRRAFVPIMKDLEAGRPREDFRALAEAVRRTGLKNPRIIEAGCGHGWNSEVLARTAYDVLQPFGTRARVARRILGRARQIIANQPRFTQPPSKKFKPLLFMHSDAFEESLSLFRLRSAAWGQGWDVYEGWAERYRRALEVPAEEVEQARERRRGGRRRRRRRRRRASEQEDSPPAPEPED